MEISDFDLLTLQRARHILENPGLAARLSNLIGAPVGGTGIVICDRSVSLTWQTPDLPRSELTSIRWSRTARHVASATVTGPPGTLALLAASLPVTDPAWWNGMPF